MSARLTTVLAVLALALPLAGCGQRGPLYLRDSPPPGMKPKPEAYKPVPYPKETGEQEGAGASRQ